MNKSPVNHKNNVPLSIRIQQLKQAVQQAKPAVCAERAVIWTQYCRNRQNRKKNAQIQIAEALAKVLREKTICIYPNELLVGNYTSKRVGGAIFPELHGMIVLRDLLRFSKRQTNPLQISSKETRQLASIIPFWLFRFLSVKAHKSKLDTLRFVTEQLLGHYYFINETGGISHIAPDYEKLISIGTTGILDETKKLQKKTQPHSDAWFFYQAVSLAAKSLSDFGHRYAALANHMAMNEPDAKRKNELLSIAENCTQVPQHGARTLAQALQSILLAQIAINSESLDNSVCPGRMDHYLYPFYKRDLRKGLITRQEAKDLICAFSIKLSEIIPVFDKSITEIHGGLFNGQVVTVGGTCKSGRDSTNELSYIFLEAADALRMRQPNFHARLHKHSPEKYVDKIMDVLCAGGNSPALYNDEIIVPTMVNNGCKIEDARNYTAVGCVEPVCQGKGFHSTDAALMNMPLMLELAMNAGKRFGSPVLTGVSTPSAQSMHSMNDIKKAFEAQVSFAVDRLLYDLAFMEKANARLHPTPLTSMLIDGCIKKGMCSTRGGATYNFSGIQCVGASDAGDSLYAIEQSVFIRKKYSLVQLINILKNNFHDRKDAAFFSGLSKFGNDVAQADRWTRYVAGLFAKILEGRRNTRGGKYLAGLYSVTTHNYFGKMTGALPSGRKRGESFAAGIAPSDGRDKNGPTAVLNSMNRLDFSRFANGINFNIKFDAQCLRGNTGKLALKHLVRTYFSRGGMQIQPNILDAATLLDARNNPDAYPHLLVRVSGYSAYFNDLTPQIQDEIIKRTCQKT